MTMRGRRGPSPAIRGADCAIGMPVYALSSTGPCHGTAWIVLAA
jgi:hypothetical protein